ncbi:hypothetical protein JZU68_07845, partial [bacterium]|nr:hypothetical protein [bacterium]
SVINAIKVMIAAANTAPSTIADGDVFNVNILEGEVVEPTGIFVGTGGGNINPQGKNIIINIVGLGADKSAMKAIVPGRVWQQNAIAAGITINFKNLTMKDFGSDLNASGANGAIFNFSVAPTAGVMTYNFENVVVSNCKGRSLINIVPAAYNVSFINCLFKSNHLIPSTNPNVMNGLINNAGGAPLVIKNCTFMSNDFKALSTTATQSSIQGALIYVNPIAAGTTVTTIENCVVINNKFIEGLTDAVSSIIYINSGTNASTLTLKNNLFIDNARAASKDKDIYFPSQANITFTSEKNIANSAIQINDGTAVPVTYKDLTFDGLKISSDYTYTDPRIAFTMDGTLPKLTNDAYGVGKVEYTGDGGTPTPQGLKSISSSNIKLITSSNSLVIAGAEVGTKIAVYSMIGSLVTKTTNTTNRTQIALKQGLYLVRVGDYAQKVQIN